MRIYPHFLQGTVLISLSLLLAGCISANLHRSAQKIASESGLISEKFDTDPFPIIGWHRLTPPVHSLRVYIEGDGFAWKSRTTPSDNPTPRNPTGLMLAAADKQTNVFYLARPCQFIGPPLPANCQVNVWTQDRFSPAVIDAMNEALSQMVLRYPGVKLDLVGYSGGGNIAALLAERRDDVRSLRTVAGNLDVAYVNAVHHVTRCLPLRAPSIVLPRFAPCRRSTTVGKPTPPCRPPSPVVFSMRWEEGVCKRR